MHRLREMRTALPGSCHIDAEKRKKPHRSGWTGVAFLEWWSWGDLNPRPQTFFEQFYMCSRLI